MVYLYIALDLRYNYSIYLTFNCQLNKGVDMVPIIYCVEDDENIRELIVYALNNNKFKAKGFESWSELSKELELEAPDLLLLDIMLPGDDGYTILDTLRNHSRTKDIPIIMISAKTSEYDKVKGLDMGADDYISKPFGVMELISRINAVLRRSGPQNNNENILTIGNLIVDLDKRSVSVDQREINLTFKEFELLCYLLLNKDLVLSRDKIMLEVWGTDFEGESRTVDVHIRTLRLKLGEAGKYIQTIRNVGYKIGG